MTCVLIGPDRADAMNACTNGHIPSLVKIHGVIIDGKEILNLI
jgi:hypothetical protein